MRSWVFVPKNLAADKAYGSGEFLAWLMARGVEPHIPVIDRRHQTEWAFHPRRISL